MLKDIDEAISSLDKAFEHAELTGEFNGDDFQSRVNACIAQFPSEKKYCLDHYKNFVNCGLGDDKNEYGFVCFAEAIVAISNDINDLPLLLSYFDDSKDPEWAFDSLMSIIEGYPDPDGMCTVLKNLATFIPKAYYWGGTIVGRMLYKPQDFALLKASLHLADKDALVGILSYMRGNKDSFETVEPQINELLGLLTA